MLSYCHCVHHVYDSISPLSWCWLALLSTHLSPFNLSHSLSSQQKKRDSVWQDRMWTWYRPNASSELVDILVRKRVKASEIDMNWYPGQRQYFDLMDVGVLSAKETDLFTTLFFPPILGFSEEMSESFAHAYSLNYKYDCSRRRPQAISCCLTKI